ncbi:MAG: YjgP/YjgQ family permease [Cytophagales bacterium]|nr:MAG: YjgP/YjgQ family permease [Cytophagales bacterium]TAF61859.1 MAG: YjgP/YjgQ family permease [Cytophagales bacterium]
MLKKIDKLVLGSFFQLFFLTFSVVLFILLMVFMAKYFEDLVGKDLGADILGQFLMYFALTLVPQALPLAVLLSSLMTFGGLGEHYELTAIKSSGVSLPRILMPVGLIALVLSFGAFHFNNRAVPEINLKTYTLLYDIKQKKPTLEFPEGAFYNGIPNWSIRINKKDPDGIGMRDIIIYDHTQQRGNTDVIVAEKGTMRTILGDQYLQMEVENGYKFSDQGSSYERKVASAFVRDKFKKARFVFPLESFGLNKTPEELFTGNRYMKNVDQLQTEADSLFDFAKRTGQNIAVTAQSYFDYQYSAVRIAERAEKPTQASDVLPSFTIKNETFSKSDMQTLYQRAISRAESLQALINSNGDRIFDYEENARRALLEMHKRYTLAVACFIMFLIGAPLGSIIKRGGLGMPVIVSIAFFIVFYVMGIMGDKFARKDIVPVLVGAWAPNFVLLLFGLFFLRQAYRDSRVFEMDIYLIFWDKITQKFAKKTNPTT